MRIDIITLHPELLQGPFEHSILKRAAEKDLLVVKLHNLRDYTPFKHKQVDDYQYGGGAGMVLMIEPVARCLDRLKKERDYDAVIYMTPDGPLLNQQMANRLSLTQNLVILCGHYKGIDQRIRDHLVTQEISIGNYVLSGGELAAAVVVDAIGRLIPGVLNDESSALFDSFQDNQLAPPVYTRPEDYQGWKVPEILLSGDQKKIDAWREEKALERTRTLRPDLLQQYGDE